MAVELEVLTVADVTAWRGWLAEHSASSPGVWLSLAKKGFSEPTSLIYDEALLEALCHGWIDGQVRRRDEATFSQRYTPRRSRSVWSARNVELVGRLTEEGRMQAAGLREVERAKADGRWAAAYAGSATMQVPDDLATAVAASPRAAAMFALLTRQNSYALCYRLGAIKRAETRQRRVADYVAMLERGETIYPQKASLPDAGG